MNIKEFFKKYAPPVYFAYFITIAIYTFLMAFVSSIAIGFAGHVFINYSESTYVKELIKLGFDEQYFYNIFDIISNWMIISVILFIIITVWSIINIKLND